MEIGDITITKREVFVCIAITLILTGLGFILSANISDVINEKNEVYFKSLKINNDEERFRYAIKTNIGNCLINGKVEAVNGVHIDELENNYFYIKKVKEKYTQHERKVAHTKTVGNKTETYYTTEIYYTWDYAGKEEYHTEQFKFLNVEFSYETLQFINTEYLTTIKVDSDTRYKYYIIPFSFEGTLFTNIQNNTLTNNRFYYDKTIDEIIQEKEKSLDEATTLFWGIWKIIIIILDFGFVYFENDYLED